MAETAEDFDSFYPGRSDVFVLNKCFSVFHNIFCQGAPQGGIAFSEDELSNLVTQGNQNYMIYTQNPKLTKLQKQKLQGVFLLTSKSKFLHVGVERNWFPPILDRETVLKVFKKRLNKQYQFTEEKQVSQPCEVILAVIGEFLDYRLSTDPPKT